MIADKHDIDMHVVRNHAALACRGRIELVEDVMQEICIEIVLSHGREINMRWAAIGALSTVMGTRIRSDRSASHKEQAYAAKRVDPDTLSTSPVQHVSAVLRQAIRHMARLPRGPRGGLARLALGCKESESDYSRASDARRRLRGNGW